jgi:hypothetical protein
MTALPRPAYEPGRLSRFGRFLLNGAIGTLLCTGPVTSVIALGWLMRRFGHLARSRFGAVEESPGWLLGPREANSRPTSRLARAFGGLGANIRSGILGLTALLAWTLPFSLLWLGAWWAGWENSFNKGYEQAVVGPAVFLLGAFLAALILPALPLMLSHVATEDRLAAAFDLRRLRSVVAQAGWRVPALSLLTALFAMPFVAVRGLITTATDWAPWVADLSADELEALQSQITLTLAALAFLTTWILRSLAARTYAQAATRAAGVHPGLWDGTEAAEGAEPARPASAIWTTLCYALAMAITLGLAFLILSGQFLDHAWWRWSFHPALTLPWAG